MSASNLLVVFTGSIACYKACEVVSGLVQSGHRVRTVTTAAARRFVGDATLEGLTGAPVAHDLFAAGAALDHIELARWADLILVCPATAHSLNRFAAGLADDLAGALLLAREPDKPLLIAPAMNPAMWAHPATQASVARLSAWGAQFIPVGLGPTACGEEGEGRLAEPDLIVATVEAALARPPRPLRILVTSGGTAEPVDGVRVLTNTSTGHTGAALAEHFARQGHEVRLLRSRSAVPAGPLCRETLYSSFADLDAALTRLLGAESFDAIVHAAAVGDFGVSAIVTDGVRRPPGETKLSSGRPIQLELSPQPKLVDQLRSRSRNPALQVIAFKLTRGADAPMAQTAAHALLAAAPADLVVHNDLDVRGAEPDDFPATLHAPDGAAPIHCASRTDLALALESFLRSAPVPA